MVSLLPIRGRVMENKLVRGKWIVAGSGNGRKIIKNGAVLIEDGTIRAIGNYEKISKEYRYDYELGSEYSAVIPGLVNSHNHGRGLSAFQGGVSDAPLELWLPDLFNSYETDIYWDTLLAAFNMISKGTTTVLCHWCERDPADPMYREDLEKSISAFLKSGLRVAIAPVIHDQNKYTYSDESKILSKLPGYMKEEIVSNVEDSSRIKKYFHTITEMKNKYCQNEKLTFQYGPNGVQWCSDDLLVQIRDKMTQNKMRVHLHLLETKYQREYSKQHFGVSTISHLEDIGFLGENTSLAHCVWLSTNDIEIISQTGVTCIHNPSSNLRLYSGIAPILALLEKDVKVALGTDSTALNDDDDIIQEMRLCWLLHRLPNIRTRGITSSEILDMATTHGATAAGFGDLIGGIEVGKKADMVLLETRRAIVPYLSLRIPPLDFLLQRITHDDVKTVIVDGHVVYENGLHRDCDPANIVAELRKSVKESPSKKADAVTRLKQLLKEHYENEELEEYQIKYKYNQLT